MCDSNLMIHDITWRINVPEAAAVSVCEWFMTRAHLHEGCGLFVMDVRTNERVAEIECDAGDMPRAVAAARDMMGRGAIALVGFNVMAHEYFVGMAVQDGAMPGRYVYDNGKLMFVGPMRLVRTSAVGAWA